MRLAANISLLFAEEPLPRRFAAARDSGFDGVEIQFPYDHDAADLAEAARVAGMPVVLVNIPAGDPAAGDVGLGALPGRRDEFRDAVARCMSYASTLGVSRVNLLSGRQGADDDPGACRETLVANLRHAADAFAPLGIRVLVEPLNPKDVPGVFLDGLAPALDVLRAAAHPNAALQFDLYHMALTEPDLPAAVSRAGHRIGHVQFADAPGRHEPFTAGLDFAAALRALRAAGYADWVAAEYRPARETRAGLGWIPRMRAMLSATEGRAGKRQAP